jgi:hypothetical protein
MAPPIPRSVRLHVASFSNRRDATQWCPPRSSARRRCSTVGPFIPARNVDDLDPLLVKTARAARSRSPLNPQGGPARQPFLCRSPPTRREDGREVDVRLIGGGFVRRFPSRADRQAASRQEAELPKQADRLQAVQPCTTRSPLTRRCIRGGGTAAHAAHPTDRGQ